MNADLETLFEPVRQPVVQVNQLNNSVPIIVIYRFLAHMKSIKSLVFGAVVSMQANAQQIIPLV